MKCIRLVGQGVPVRLPDDEARQIVEKDHDGEYCTKQFFREWWTRNKMPETMKRAD